MSNVTFNIGDFNKQKTDGVSDGILFLNPQNRYIGICNDDTWNILNILPVNDNLQMNDTNDFTQSSLFLKNNIVNTMSDKNNLYYSIDNALSKIGNTNITMTNGYISNILSKLINGITYESQFSYEDTYGIVSMNYKQTTRTYTFYYPNTNIPNEHNFNMLIVFKYDMNGSLNKSIILNVDKQEDLEYKIVETNSSPSGNYPTINDYVYKAFWA